ncbi:hypothetical protein [Oceanidesulfovibrio marinus]|uniref:hypothetical protein n=1 Tax=Oceanidesulfovibrio marinus TaxID=370038 RepID=UPI001186A10A|nr:hypothetical protein [Oceanidesulfovibrio marinus]
MGKNPAFQFYPGDWLRDNVAGCSLAAQGLWLRMMMLMHETGGYISVTSNVHNPIPPANVARRCGCSPDEYETLLAELDAAGVPSRTEGDVIYSRRMVRDFEDRAKNAARVKRHRERSGNGGCNSDVTGDVMPMKHASSSSSSSSDKEEDVPSSCGESCENRPDSPPPTPDPVLFTVQTTGPVKEWHLLRSYLDRWLGLYPELDVEYEIRKAIAWLEDNPRRRKTAKGMKSFITSWLSRAQDSGKGRRRSEGGPTIIKTETISNEEFMRMCEQDKKKGGPDGR